MVLESVLPLQRLRFDLCLETSFCSSEMAHFLLHSSKLLCSVNEAAAPSKSRVAVSPPWPASGSGLPLETSAGGFPKFPGCLRAQWAPCLPQLLSANCHVHPSSYLLILTICFLIICTVWDNSLRVILISLGFPGGASGKDPTCQCRRHKKCGFDPLVGKIPGGGWGNPLQYPIHSPVF